MKPRRSQIFMVALLLSSFARGQEDWKKSDRKDIESVLTEYTEIFSMKAYERLPDVCQTPFIQVTDRGTVVMKTMQEVIASYRRSREALDATGYKASRVTLADTRISVLSPTRVLVNLPYGRYKADGSLLERGSGYYILSKSSGKWRITGMLPQDPRQTGKVY